MVDIEFPYLEIFFPLGWKVCILSDISCTNAVIIFTTITSWAFINVGVYIINLLEEYPNIFLI